MNCQKTLDMMDDFVDGTLSAKDHDELEVHIASCQSCRLEVASLQELLADLGSVTYQGPGSDVLQQSLREAVSAGRSVEYKQRLWRGLVVAAVICLLVSVSLTNSFLSFDKEQAVDALTITLYEQKTVTLLVDTKQALDNARITINLPSQLSLAGFPGQQQISWQSDLLAGKNLLKLPVMANEKGYGVISTSIHHNNKNKIYNLATNIIGPG